MAFERMTTGQGTDYLIGKPLPRTDNPWFPASPTQNRRAMLAKKAPKVKARQERWTEDEMQELFALMVLSHD